MTWIGTLFLIGFLLLIFPELLILPIFLILIFFEFILRLFGKSFDDSPAQIFKKGIKNKKS